MAEDKNAGSDFAGTFWIMGGLQIIKADFKGIKKYSKELSKT